MANNDNPPAVLSATKNLRLREAMLLGSGLEGGWTSPYPVGDNGTSFGPYQMHEGGALTALGLTPAQAENARTATKAMLPSYSNAVNQISPTLWQQDPEKAAEQAAVIAEAPAQDYYATHGNSGVNAVWKNTQNVLSGKNSLGGNPTQQGQTTSIITSLLGGLFGGAIGNIGGDLRDWLERGGLIIFGAMLCLVGIWILAQPSVKKATEEGVSAYGQARSFGASGAANQRFAAGQAERQARQAQRNEIANRSLALGEKKLALKQQRENRLAGKQDFG